MKISQIVVSTLMAGALLGCATAPKLNDFAPAAATAAYVGTTVAIQEHPEWLAGFKQANEDLKVLASAPNPDYATLAAIVQRLPVKELKSNEARIAIDGATILLQQYGRPDVVTQKLQDIRPLVLAVQSGLERALAGQ